MYCCNCGVFLAEGSRFCHECGTKVQVITSAPQISPQPKSSAPSPNSVYKLEPSVNACRTAPQAQNYASPTPPAYESKAEKRKKNTKGLIALGIVIIIGIIAYFSSCMYQHKWVPATCTEPKTCSRCGETSGVAKGHQYNTPANNNTPAICSFCGEMKPLSLPATGQVFIGKNKDCYSSLTIRSSSSESCYIKLKDAYGNDAFSFFVRAGTTVEVDVPEGKFYVYFAHGTDWYGTDLLFGPNTTYSKDDELLDFTQYSWEYTLYPVSNGNFSETPISEDEF